MKRLIAFLSVLLCAPAYADGFGVNDKVLYFNSNVLIDVIKNTFPQNLQLDVANKYVELMDKSGNVSIADLITVCGVGNLDNAKCRNFINDLITAMGDDTIKPFYWADYVSVDPEPIRLQTYSSGDGYHKNPGLGPGEWAMTFGWMKDSKFIKQYPQTKYIRGHSACTADAGTPYTIDAGKNYALNETDGDHCWCKMVGPEESPWVYNKGGDTMAGGCDRSCALECLSALRTEPMRATMFSVVKLNGSNANTSDERVIGDALKDEFKPCEFDWAKDTLNGGSVSGVFFSHDDETVWVGWKTQKPKYNEQPAVLKYREWLIDFVEKKGLNNHLRKNYELFKQRQDDADHYENNASGLKNEEWAAGGFSWMKSENFQCKYPGVSKIKGIAACTNEKIEFGKTSNKSFKSGETTGFYCWCKMTYPEQSKWLLTYSYDFETRTNFYSSTLNVGLDTRDKKTLDLPEEGKRLAFLSDSFYCDSYCLQYCGLNFDLFWSGFASVGKK